GAPAPDAPDCAAGRAGPQPDAVAAWPIRRRSCVTPILGTFIMLVHLPRLLTQDEVRQCRDALDAAVWEDGRVTAGHLAVRAKSNLQLPLDSPVARKLGELILARLGQNPVYLSAVLPARVLPP